MNKSSKLLLALAIGLTFPALHSQAQQTSTKSFTHKPATVSNHTQSLTEIEFNENEKRLGRNSTVNYFELDSSSANFRNLKRIESLPVVWTQENNLRNEAERIRYKRK